MPSADAIEFRVYCICGQKMRVSEAMFGRPGKCVACSQKIRVPTPEELPDGVLDVYLKDFPQFLRKPSRRGDDGAAGDEVEDATLGDRDEGGEIVALDVFEAVRRLCSYEYHVTQALARLREGAARGAGNAQEKTALMGYRALARKARSELDERMRQRLMDVAVELADVKDRIARCTLSARVGEVEFQEFLEVVLPLRRRRECLERLRYNLRGWLAVSDPFLAGGLLDLPLQDPPVDIEETEFPEVSPAPNQALIEQLLQSLREALEEREYAERKLEEWRRVEQEGGLTGFNIERYKVMAAAARTRARAAAAFLQERVQQALQDADGEVKAVRAHLELARHRLDAGELTSTQFNTVELELLRAQADSAKACDAARQALEARSVDDIPRVQSNLFRRLAKRRPTGVIGVDSWFAWVGALALVLAIFVPITDRASGGNAVAVPGLLVGLVVAAAATALAAAIPNRRARGTAIGLIWLAGGVALALCLYDKYHGIERVSEMMRRDRYWMFEPGMLFIAGGGLLIAASFCIALFQERRMWHIPLMIVGTAGIIISAAATEMAGYLKPNPVVTGITHILADTTDPRAPLQYRVQVTVSNEGRRACRLNPRALSSPDPVSYRVARHTAGNDWDYEIYPIRVKTGGEDWRDLAGAAGEAVLHPGDEGIFEYVLGPGDYRVELHPRWLREGQTRMFTLERGQTPPEDASVDDVPGGETPTFPEYVPAPAPDQDPMPAPDDSLPPEDTPAPAAPSRASGPELELRGIGSDPVGGPRFVLMLHHRDGRSHAFRVGLGERVFRAWSATEYDPQRQTLTIGLLDDEGRVTDVRILHTGERVALPMSEPPQAP